jgi:hypothetical protein
MTVTVDTEKIVQGLNEGLDLHNLSQAHNLSREKIRQIAEQSGQSPTAPQDYIAPAHVRLIRLVSTYVCNRLDRDEVLTATEVRVGFPASSAKWINSAVEQAELIPLLGVPDPPDKVEFTVDDMHTALRAAADLIPEGVELTGPAYDRLLKDGSITGPSRVLIIQRIGSWSAACEGAKVLFRAARREYEGFTPEEVQIFLDIYGLDMVKANTPITFASYSQWAKDHQKDGAPSGSLIKARMLTGTSWNQMRDQLILRTYHSMPQYWVKDETQATL